MIDLVTAAIGMLVAILVGLGLGALLRRPRTGGTTPTPQRPEPVPDTITEEIDDELAGDTAEAVQDSAAAHGVSPEDVKAALEAADKQRRR